MTNSELTASAPVLAVGEILWDLLPSGPRLGGAMANLALGCARLGRGSGLISCVGQDARGAAALQTLEAMGQAGGRAPFDMSLIQRTDTAPTGVVDVKLGEDGRPAYEIALPAAWDRIEATPQALAAAGQARALCFGTLAQRVEPSRSALRALVQAAPANCLRMLDVNVRAPYFSGEVLRWSLQSATAAKISDEELDTVSRLSGGGGLRRAIPGDLSLEAVRACGAEILAAYPNLEVLAVTLGPAGSLLMAAGQSDHHRGFPVVVRDTVGAGDAFTAGFVHGWLAGAPLQAVNEVGNLCGSYVASQHGATPVFPPELLRKVAASLGVGAV